MTHWTILTCEYPPGCGGVGDYTAQVAAALAAAGDTVTVFCPPPVVPAPRDLGDVVEPPGVEVVTTALSRLEAALRARAIYAAQ